MVSVVLGIVIIGIFFLWFGLNQVNKTQRREAMSRVAEQMGLGFFAEDPFDLEAQVNFNLFSHNIHSWQKHGIINVLPGVLGDTEILLFDRVSTWFATQCGL